MSKWKWDDEENNLEKPRKTHKQKKSWRELQKENARERGKKKWQKKRRRQKST